MALPSHQPMSEAMNAPNPVPPATGSGDARPYEPSMEEILASIRRIIADDQSLPGRVRTEEPTPDPFEPTSLHVLHREETTMSEERSAAEAASEPPPPSEAVEMMAQGSIATPQFPSPEFPSPEIPVVEPTFAEPIVAEPTAAEPMVARPALSDRLEAIHREAHGEPVKQEIATRMDGSNDYFDPPEEYDRPAALPSEPAALFSATTNSSVASAFNVLAASRLADNSDELLGMAREMIRPLLRTWLDENLPSMVERMVRDEIERVARGGH